MDKVIPWFKEKKDMAIKQIKYGESTKSPWNQQWNLPRNPRKSVWLFLSRNLSLCLIRPQKYSAGIHRVGSRLYTETTLSTCRGAPESPISDNVRDTTRNAPRRSRIPISNIVRDDTMNTPRRLIGLFYIMNLPPRQQSSYQTSSGHSSTISQQYQPPK